MNETFSGDERAMRNRNDLVTNGDPIIDFILDMCICLSHELPPLKFILYPPVFSSLTI